MTNSSRFRTAEQVSIEGHVSTNFSAGNEKGLHGNRPLIIDLPQGTENLRPGKSTLSGRAAVGFVLNVHVERVEEKFAVGASYTFAKMQFLRRRCSS